MPQSDLETPRNGLLDATTAPPARWQPRKCGARLGWAALGVGIIFALAGCPANLANPQDYAPAPVAAAGSAGNGTISVPVPPCMTAVISASCGNVGCHSASAPQADLDLVSPNLGTRLINVPATHKNAFPSTGCVPDKLIDSATPSASWLVQKLTDAKDCGFLMPVGPALTADQIACFTQYASDVGKAAGGM